MDRDFQRLRSSPLLPQRNARVAALKTAVGLGFSDAFPSVVRGAASVVIAKTMRCPAQRRLLADGCLCSPGCVLPSAGALAACSPAETLLPRGGQAASDIDLFLLEPQEKGPLSTESSLTARCARLPCPHLVTPVSSFAAELPVGWSGTGPRATWPQGGCVVAQRARSQCAPRS